MTGHDGGADDVLGRVADEVHGQVREASSWEHRFAVLDQAMGRVMAARADSAATAPDAVAYAWRLLLTSGGRMPVRALASAVGYSERHLANTFRTEVGLTPKAAARVIRFDRARRALQAEAVAGPVRISDIAARHGYYDHAHLVRDFVEFTGWAPSRWLAEEFGNVQAVDHRDAAD